MKAENPKKPEEARLEAWEVQWDEAWKGLDAEQIDEMLPQLMLLLSAMAEGDPKPILEDEDLREIVDQERIERATEAGEWGLAAEEQEAVKDFQELVQHPQLAESLLKLLPAFQTVFKAFWLYRKRFPEGSVDEFTKRYPEEVEELSRLFKSWEKIFKQKPQESPLIPEAFSAGYGFIPSPASFRAIVEAITDADEGAPQWTKEADRPPTYSHQERGGTTYVSMDLKEEEQMPMTEEVKAKLWDYVQNMTDLTADVLCACLAQWIWQTDDPEHGVWITAEKILDYRGVKPMYKKERTGKIYRAGHRKEDKIAIAQEIQRLDHVWLDIVNIQLKGKKFTFESKALVISSRAKQGLLEGGWESLAWRIRPGDWGKYFLTGPGRQTALLAQKALEYNPYRQDWEKRLARYFAFQWRIRASRGRFEQPFKVKTLLKAAHKEVDRRHPRRTFDRFAAAMDRLEIDGVVQEWHYRDFDAWRRIRQQQRKRGWLADWLEMTVLVKPPETIPQHYQEIARRRKPRLPKPQGRKQQAEGEISGEEIRNAREACGLSQQDLANRLGISQSTLSKIETGRRSPSPEIMLRLYQWLESQPCS